MACFKPDRPKDINYTNLMTQTFQGQRSLAPQQYEMEAQYQPQYAQLALGNLNTLLRGANGQPGLLELLRSSSSQQRAGDLGDVTALGPQTRDAILASNPDQAALLERMNSQALAGLDAEDRLTPDQSFRALDPVRSRYAQSGFAPGSMQALEEGMNLFGAGQQAQSERRGFAGDVLGANQAVVGDIYSRILGQPSNLGVDQGQGLLEQSGPSLFNPESPLASSIASGNQQMRAMFNTSTAQQVSNAMAPLNETMSSY